MVLSPKISSLLLPVKRQMVLNSFLKEVETKKNLDGYDYWKFREFYSPGYFSFSKTGISEILLKSLTSKLGMVCNSSTVSAYLVFSSESLNSLDMLTKQTDLKKIINTRIIPKTNIILSAKNVIIYKTDPKVIKIAFLLDGSKMPEVSGFSDYIDKDLVKGKNWLNITSLIIN
jgi:hypothetical protein